MRTPKTLPQRFNDAELEAVVGLWLSKHKIPSPSRIPTYKWAQGVLESAKRQDVEPWVLIRRFPLREPRIGWWGFLKWLEVNPEPLKTGDVGFGSWQARIVAVRSKDQADGADYVVVEVLNGVQIKIPRGRADV